jgi:diguanylate cyclase (GGDEF)-like protein
MFFTALLGVSTLAVLVLLDWTGGLVPANPLVVFALVAMGFACAELAVFDLEYRRESMAFSLSEVPLAFALVFLAPPLVVLARLAGATIAIARERPGPLKLVHNLSVFSFEAVVATAILRLIAADGGEPGLVLVLGVLVAIIGASLLGGLTIAVTVSFFEGNVAAKAGDLFSSWAGSGVYLLGAIVGASTVSVALLNPLLTPLPLLMICAAWAILRAYGRLTQDHRDLTEVHGFTAALVRSLALHETASAAVTEARRLLRAEHCALYVLDPDSGRQRLASGSGPLLAIGDAVEPGSLVGRPVDTPTVVPAEELSGLGRAAEGISELVVCPVSDGHGLLGWLLLANRQGVLDRFSPADLERCASLVGQLATALRNSLLHDQIEHEASHDRLTHLANRAQFERGAASALDRPLSSEVVGALVLDVHRFREVNDTLGHQVGDQLLMAAAERMAGLVDHGDVLARFGGDEFAVLARRSDASELQRLAGALVSALRRPFEMGELTVVVTASVGVAYAPDHARDVTTLLRRADIALHEAKARHSSVEVYRADIDRSSSQRLAMHGELRALLEARQLQVHFQPKVDLATRTVVGVEALARWEHPSRGFVSPEEFVALAEQTGLIHQLTDQVLANALAAARHWQRKGAALGVAVNLSAHNLLDELLVERVARLLDRFAVDPGQLTLEITESSVMAEAERTLATLEHLRDLGVNLSVDDFGTGYSSLSYLRKLPVTEVKIDRSFVAELLLADQDEVIVRSTIDLGHNLGLQVVAEGVENEPVLARLRELGCDLAQGYGISRPLPLAKVDAWLKTAPYAVRRSAGWDPAHIELP